jgi:hypothetical protein
MMPLTWALKEVDPVGLHLQSGIHAQEIKKIRVKVVHGEKWLRTTALNDV